MPLFRGLADIDMSFVCLSALRVCDFEIFSFVSHHKHGKMKKKKKKPQQLHWENALPRHWVTLLTYNFESSLSPLSVCVSVCLLCYALPCFAMLLSFKTNSLAWARYIKRDSAALLPHRSRHHPLFEFSLSMHTWIQYRVHDAHDSFVC